MYKLIFIEVTQARVFAFASICLWNNFYCYADATDMIDIFCSFSLSLPFVSTNETDNILLHTHEQTENQINKNS